jgi:cytochrome c-type biogenesis protein CcmF
MTLVIMTFFLTIFGTFMTRSGIVQSVHAFGQDIALAWMFTIFMVVLLIFSFGLVIYRLPLLRARNELESWVSREAAFLVNNWILLFSAVFVLFATMFPTLSEAVTGMRLTVGPPFYTKWMLPIGLILLTLTGIGPLLAWRRSSPSNLLYQFMWPATLAVATGVGLYAIGFQVWVSGLCFALCAFVVGTIGQEFIRGAAVRREATGTDLLTAMIGLVARSRRRYGGYVVHVGIVLMFLGFAGTGYKLDSQVLLKPGDAHTLGPYTVRYDRLSQNTDSQKQMITAHMTVLEGDEVLGELYPARWFFFKHESEPTTEVAMRRTVADDLYIVLAGYELSDQAASFQITVNPLVNWIWFGFTVLALGTGIALLPESAFAFAGVTVPQGAATATMALLAFGLTALAPAAAAAAQPGQLELEMQRSLVCMCGSPGCGKKILAECTCVTAAATREELRNLVAEGLTRDEVLRFYIDKHQSQEALAAPLDEGFNRLAWLFPYFLAATGAVALGAALVRWTRPGQAAPADDRGPDRERDQLEARLDDELRDLD